MKRGPHQELTTMSLAEASRALRQRRVTSTALTQACLQRIEKLDPLVNAFITVTPEIALERARAADRDMAQGRWRGPLHGIPLALKDNLDTAGITTTAASAVYRNRVPDDDAEVVRRLKNAGAVLLGKLNMDEFAIGWGTTNSHWGPARNPWSLRHVAGGSSGGCAAALAANLCYGSVGTDTGGSVRMPASCCGVVGLKPSYGLVSNRGVVPDIASLQHVGPLCRSVADAAIVLRAIAGHDPAWAPSARVEIPDYLEALSAPPPAPLRVGIARRDFMEDLDGDIDEAMRAAIEVIAGFADVVADIRFPELDQTIFPRLFAEAHAFHKTLLEQGAPYQPPTRKILQRSAAVSADACAQAARLLAACRAAGDGFFRDAAVDLVAMPTFRTATPTIEAMKAELEGFASFTQATKPASNTAAFNILGLPAISIPCGFDRAGLPIGLQIVGRRFDEARLLCFARRYEQATRWPAAAPLA